MPSMETIHVTEAVKDQLDVAREEHFADATYSMAVQRLIDAYFKIHSNPVQVNDAVVSYDGSEHSIRRVIAVTTTGLAIVEGKHRLAVEREEKPFMRVGHFKRVGIFWRRWKFVSENITTGKSNG